jgi:nicotinamidase-related amidase
MPLTTVDPTPALVVIDLQQGIVSGAVAHVVPRAAALAKAFRRHGLPVVLVNVTGRAPGRTDAGDLGVTQIVLAGVSTSSGVESTARSAHDHGYHVVLATDAMADPDPDSHRHSLERVFPKLGETAASAEIIDFLDRAAGHPDPAAAGPSQTRS